MSMRDVLDDLRAYTDAPLSPLQNILAGLEYGEREVEDLVESVLEFTREDV